jgi:hypothetical protein
LSFGTYVNQSLERVSLQSFGAPGGGDLSYNVFVTCAGCALSPTSTQKRLTLENHGGDHLALFGTV